MYVSTALIVTVGVGAAIGHSMLLSLVVPKVYTAIAFSLSVTDATGLVKTEETPQKFKKSAV